MDNSYIKNNLEQIFESFKEMIKVETVVGQAVHIGDAILIPFVDVTFGFGSGGVNGKTENGRSSAGSGGGAKMEPAAILVIKGDRVENVLHQERWLPRLRPLKKLIAMAPESSTDEKRQIHLYSRR